MASKQSFSKGLLRHSLQIFLLAVLWTQAFSASVGRQVPKWERPCDGSQVASVPIYSSEESEEYIQPFSSGAYRTSVDEAQKFAHSFKNHIKALINDPVTICRLDYLIQQKSARNPKSMTPEQESLFENFPRSPVNRSADPMERKEVVYQTISRVYIFLNQREQEEGNEPAKRRLLLHINRQLIHILCALYSNGIRPLLPLSPKLAPRMPAGSGRSDRDVYDYIMAEQTIRVLEGLGNYL